MALDELSALEQNDRLAMFHQNQQFQRAVRDAASQAAFDSPARFEMTLCLALRQAQFNRVSTMRHREREILFRLGNEAQTAVRQHGAHMVHEQHQLVLNNPFRSALGGIGAMSIFEDSRMSLTGS